MVGRVRVSEITAPDGLSAVAAPYGVKFNNNASSDANTLDWYQEGLWTPTVYGGSTAGTCTYSTREASFIRIGKIVILTMRVDWTGHTGTGQLNVSGLPFASGNPFTNSTGYGFPLWSNGLGQPCTTHFVSGLTSFNLYHQNAASYTSQAIVSNGGLIISGQSYIA